MLFHCAYYPSKPATGQRHRSDYGLELFTLAPKRGEAANRIPFLIIKNESVSCYRGSGGANWCKKWWSVQWESGQNFDRGRTVKFEWDWVQPDWCHYRSIPLIKPMVDANGEVINRLRNPYVFSVAFDLHPLIGKLSFYH